MDVRRERISSFCIEASAAQSVMLSSEQLPAALRNFAISTDNEEISGGEVPRAIPPDFDFDRVIPRCGTDSVKWNRYPAEVLPMFVADMDLPSPERVKEAIRARTYHECFGYALAVPEAVSTVQEMLLRKYNWRVEPETIVFLPGLVSALSMAARMTLRSGRELLVPTPCYPPFVRAPRYMDIIPTQIPMVHNPEGNWQLPSELTGGLGAYTHSTLFLCNPHNPTGRVLRRSELETVANWASQTDSIIVSDEIHAELILEPSCEHIPIASLSPEVAKRTITLLSPSKTFNIPGLGIAFAVVPDAALRDRFTREGGDIVPPTGIFGYPALIAAYREGEPWREALIDYLRKNRERMSEVLAPYGELVRFTPPEATYLAWLDLRATGWENPAQHLLEYGNVALGEGREFCMPGFARLTFGCPRSTLDEGLSRICRALDAHRASTR